MLLNILQYTKYLPIMMNHLVQNVNRAELENPCCRRREGIDNVRRQQQLQKQKEKWKSNDQALKWGKAGKFEDSKELRVPREA